MLNKNQSSPKEQYQEQLEELTEALVEEIEKITGDYEWFNVDVSHPEWNNRWSKVADIPSWIMGGFAVDCKRYNAQGIHPKLDNESLEKAVNIILEKVGKCK